MKKGLAYLLIGILFGIVMTKSEAISWFRIIEMFRFESIHMYGIIGTAVALGIGFNWLLKKSKTKDVFGNEIIFKDKEKGIYRTLIGGTIFGLGWAMTGACPGPLFILLGHGYATVGVVILSAMLGTFLYGLFKDKLPH